MVGGRHLFCKKYILQNSKHCNYPCENLLIGFYCPLGNVTPVPCPKGTYGPTAGAESIDSCLKCPPHHYCPRPGLAASLPCGPAAQQPLSGQVFCICPGQGQNFQVSVFVQMIISLCVQLGGPCFHINILIPCPNHPPFFSCYVCLIKEILNLRLH